MYLNGFLCKMYVKSIVFVGVCWRRSYWVGMGVLSLCFCFFLFCSLSFFFDVIVFLCLRNFLLFELVFELMCELWFELLFEFLLGFVVCSEFVGRVLVWRWWRWMRRRFVRWVFWWSIWKEWRKRSWCVYFFFFFDMF